MRIGQNPAKAIESLPQPERVTVAVVTYIPFLSGYYAQSLEVLKICLGSLWENTPEPHDLLIFDNASCPEVRKYLTGCLDEGRIQTLMLSNQNIGKGGAWNTVFQGAPGEVIAYTDSDVYFYPRWLTNSLEILDAYPMVGMVTARPMRTPPAFYSSTLNWAQSNPDVLVENESFMSWETYHQHLASLGVDEHQAREWYDGGKDWRLTYRGIKAHIGAAHFQFTALKSVLGQFAPFAMSRPMGQVRTLDEQLNSAGFLRLGTCNPLVVHLGNSTDTDFLAKHSQAAPSRTAARGKRKARRWSDLPIVKKPLMKIYHAIFRMYHS